RRLSVPALSRRIVRRSSARKLLSGAVIHVVVFSFFTHGGIVAAQSSAGTTAEQIGTVRVDAAPGHVINSFDPDNALGSSIDVLSKTGIDKVYTPHIVQEALSAGWGPITYRNNSELRMAAWHWTESGTWSDEAHKSGYFTGSSEIKEPLRYILSYALSRAPKGQWKTFPSGMIRNGQGERVVLKLAPEPVSTRYVRVWMTESSNTCDAHGSDDVRNCVGYAIQEFKAGTANPDGTF